MTFSILTILLRHSSIIFLNLWGYSINFFTFYCLILSTSVFKLIPTVPRLLFFIFELVVAIDDPRPFYSEKEASKESIFSSLIENWPLFLSVSECLTTSGDKCIFPFKMYNVLYYSCIRHAIHLSGEPFCATEMYANDYVDYYFLYNDWKTSEICSSDCEIIDLRNTTYVLTSV